jgi:chromosome partitioning protein
MEHIIAFHSYKGGTGKTTIAANYAAVLASKGYRVCLLDLDVYAPSLHTYFEKRPARWLNDYLISNINIQEILIDFTHVVYGSNNHQLLTNKEGEGEGESRMKAAGATKEEQGKLWVGFCNNKREEVHKMEVSSAEAKKQMFRKLILLRERLTSTYSLDYLIIDTSPGIRYWSINALAVADVFLLMLKMGDLDIEGTKEMANSIYTSFTRDGSKPFLLCNRVAGYCVPPQFSSCSNNNNNNNNNNSYLQGQKNNSTSSTTTAAQANVRNISSTLGSNNIKLEQQRQQQPLLPPPYINSDIKKESGDLDFIGVLSDEIDMQVISTIPCYCDIQFSKKEFLTALKYPEHPFAKQINQFVEIIQNIT